MSSNADDQRARSIMAAVNAAIDRLHHSLGMAESDFFCECGHIGCRERLTLSRAEYASRIDESRPLVSAAHADREDAAATELQRLRGQVHQLQGTLADRVKIEQAKSVLVERHGMTPDEALEILRARAGRQGRSLGEVCAQIIDHAGILDAERSSEWTPTRRAERSGERVGR